MDSFTAVSVVKQTTSRRLSRYGCRNCKLRKLKVGRLQSFSRLQQIAKGFLLLSAMRPDLIVRGVVLMGLPVILGITCPIFSHSDRIKLHLRLLDNFRRDGRHREHSSATLSGL
jgi:hypothetical protein